MKKETIKNVTSNRIYNILLKRKTQYCFICCKRSGSFYDYCGPSNWYRRKPRNERNWKQKRKTKWK